MVSFEKIAKKVDGFNAKKNKTTKGTNFYFFLSVSLDILLAIVTGTTIGFFLDFLFKTKFICMIIFVFLGFTGAITNIYRKINKEN